MFRFSLLAIVFLLYVASSYARTKCVDLADLAQYTLEVLDKYLTNTKILLAESKNAANDIVLQYYYQCIL
jgi:hypothetical protein